MPASSSSTSSLLYVASPATAPAASHQRGSARSSARITSSETSGQATRSNDEVRNTWPNRRTAEVVAIPQAVQACAFARAAELAGDQGGEHQAARPPTGSPGTRSSHGPPSYSDARPWATSGVSGGWSTYPQAGRSIAK